MTYQETVDYLDSLINYEKATSFPYVESFKLERLKDFLFSLNNPYESLRFIHIAGTKGKGSTCAFVSYILKEAGFKVGLYTSPHLNTLRERIRILNPTSTSDIPPSKDFEGMISEDELVELVKNLKPKIENYNKNSKYGSLSFFEIYTTLAFMYFKEKKVDFVVLETGLGGRLDATNVVFPLVCAITPISYEHTQKLGSTLSEIAHEKAGIIKSRDSVVLSAVQEPEVRTVIRARCEEIGARLYEIGRDIFWEELDYDQEREIFNLRGIFDEYPHLEIRLLGSHQVINATLAVGIIEALRFSDITIPSQAITLGLKETFWPGRFEIICQNPTIILDGAQNIASSLALRGTLKKIFNPPRLTLILGISNDKDIKGICEALLPLASEVILTKADNPRATAPQMLKQIIQKNQLYFDKNITLTSSVKEAMERVKTRVIKEDLVLVTGSLFVVGEAREILLPKTKYRGYSQAS